MKIPCFIIGLWLIIISYDAHAAFLSKKKTAINTCSTFAAPAAGKNNIAVYAKYATDTATRAKKHRRHNENRNREDRQSVLSTIFAANSLMAYAIGSIVDYTIPAIVLYSISLGLGVMAIVVGCSALAKKEPDKRYAIIGIVVGGLVSILAIGLQAIL